VSREGKNPAAAPKYKGIRAEKNKRFEPLRVVIGREVNESVVGKDESKPARRNWRPGRGKNLRPKEKRKFPYRAPKEDVKGHGGRGKRDLKTRDQTVSFLKGFRGGEGGTPRLVQNGRRARTKREEGVE